MISHSSIAPAVTANNNADDQAVNSLEPMNYLNLPIEMRHKILSFCTVDTLLSLRKTAKEFYKKITQEVIRSKIYQENIPRHSTLYSTSCYENFIAPILNNINPQLKENISQYLAQAKNNNVSFKNITEFIGSKIVMMNHQLEKNIFTTKNINLERNRSVIFNANNMFCLFAMSELSNNCVFSTANGRIALYSFGVNNTLEQVDQFYSNEPHVHLKQLEFSPKNNLLVVTDDEMLILWKLNLNTDPLIKNEILWKLNLDVALSKIIMFQNEKQFIYYKHGEDSISVWKLDDKHQISKQPIANFLNIYGSSAISNIVMSSNNNCIALADACLGLIRLFSKTNNQTQFSEDNMPKDIYNTRGIAFTYNLNYEIQLNAKGNICAYINYRYHLILLNKFDNIWHHILYLDNAVYSHIKLSPYDTYLCFVKNVHSPDLLNTISLKDIGLNSITSDDDKRQINNDKRNYNNHYLVENNIGRDIPYEIHPTGLAIAIFDSFHPTLTLYT